MSDGSQKRGPMDFYIRERKADPPPAYERKENVINGRPAPIVQKSGFVSNLWETAVANTRKRMPAELLGLEAPDILRSVCTEAEARREDSQAKQWKVKMPGKNGQEVKLRDVYGSIVSCATKFRDVGDLAIQADPGHAALPWAAVRLCLSAAINEHEMYGVMIQGIEMVSGLVTHYIVIERVFLDEDSDHANAVKNSLLTLYTAIMDFLLEALRYFPAAPPQREENDKKWHFRQKLASGADKVRRAFQSLDATAQASIKGLLTKVSTVKNNVDWDANHAYAAMNVQVLDGFGKTQSRIRDQLESMGLAEEERDRRLAVILEEFETPMASIDEKVTGLYEEMERNQQKAQLSRVLDWLSPAALESRRQDQHKFLSDPTHRLPFSGRWILEDQESSKDADYRREYLHWQNSKDSSVAWLRGTSGTGKTVLFSTIIDQLRSQIGEDGRADHLAFCYASGKEASSWTDPDEVLRNILRQLSHAPGGSAVEAVTKRKYDQLTKSAGNEPARPTMAECVEMIVALTREFPIIIVIDALDELGAGKSAQGMHSSRNDLIESLSEILQRCSNPVKILLSTLSDSPAETRLRHDARNAEDISRFIDGELDKKIRKHDLLAGEVDEDLRAIIKNRTFERSNGMFRYASMQIDRLCNDSMDRLTVLDELEKPLPGITSLYEQSVTEIQNERIDRVRMTAQTALRWLMCVQEEIPMSAFLEAVCVEGGIDKPKESNLHSACRMLVRTDHRQPTDIFSFTHPSVKEYLAAVPAYSETDCHLAAADRCLRMMIVATSSISRLTAPQVRFYWYAKLYWPLHYQKIDFSIESEDKDLHEERQRGFVRVRELLKKFIMQGHKTSPAFDKWIAEIPNFVQGLGVQHPLSKQLSSLQASLETPLHVICVFGFAELVNQHHKHFKFDQRNAHGQTALCLAVENDQLDTVKALLSPNRADVNEFNVKAVHQMQPSKAVHQVKQEDFSPVICYANALQAAAVRGSKEMVATLIENGARPHLVAGYYGDALQAACLNGHKGIVSMLLDDHDFDPNTQGGFHGNALQAAASNANIEIVDLLLNDTNVCELTPGGHYGSALMAAACAGSKEVIDCLLAHTDDIEALVNVKSEVYGTPLQQAADMNRDDIVDILIGSGAHINALGASADEKTDKSSSSPLALAAWGGHRKIVTLLCKLRAEADLSYTENKFHLLHQAALCNMVDLAQYCIDEQCDVDMVTDHGAKYHDMQRKKTPLSIACAEGHLEMVELLMHNGARLQYSGDDVSTLQLAARGGHVRIINALIAEHKNRHTANQQATLGFIDRHITKSQSTALIEAIKAGASSAVSILLEHGAALSPKEKGVTPLHEATAERKDYIVQILIEHMKKASNMNYAKEIDARNIYGKTALVDAAERNCIRIFQLLVQHGADCKTRDNNKNSLLHYVAWRNHHELAKILLDKWDQEEPGTKTHLLETPNVHGNTGLQEALFRKNFVIVRMLIGIGAKLTTSNRSEYFIRINRQTNIDDIRHAISAFDGHPEELHKFLNHRNRGDGFSLLHDAAQHDRLDIAQLVLEHGADATTMEAESSLDFGKVEARTALHVANWERRKHVVEILLRYAKEQCDKARLSRFVNRKNNSGKTVLMAAAETNQLETMRLLLTEYDADWSLTDNSGHNTLHYCAYRGHKACVELLLAHASGIDSKDPMKQSPMGQTRFKALLNQQSNTDKITPMHDITGRGYTELAKILLNTYHAEYEIYDRHGDSILQRAVQANHDELLKPYLEYMAQDRDQEKFKRVLLHRNTSVNRTVLQGAEVRGRKELVELLKRYGA